MSEIELTNLTSENEYAEYYYKTYCSKQICTFDGIPITFRKKQFYHAFFESSKGNKKKDIFSSIRAERIKWIAYTLKESKAILYQGWLKKKRCYDPFRRVTLIYGNYVVVIQLRYTKKGILVGDFITAFVAEDDTISKIKSSPNWIRPIKKAAD